MPDPKDDLTAAWTFLGDGERGATFDASRTYRYCLWRRWGEGRLAAFIGLNPSTADEREDDPTIRRCIGFAKSWGCDGLVMLNLFAFRATQPADMKAVVDPVGPENDDALRQLTTICHPVVCCWGVDGNYKYRGFAVKSLLRSVNHGSVFHLGLCKGGQPKHPLYLKANTELTKWT